MVDPRESDGCAAAQRPALCHARMGWWLGLLATGLLGGTAHAQPLMPDRPARTASYQSLAEAAPAAAFSGLTLSVDPASREEVRQFYRAVYSASEGVPMEWSGDYASSDPATAAGDTSDDYKDAVILRVNFYRAMAGVPAGIARNATYSAKAQLAAIMMSVNRSLSHTPPSSWLLYTADGYEAAGNSNLALGMAGPDAIDGYMIDPGSNNEAVGHRRWVLHPQTRIMGTGDVPGDGSYYAANDLWVFDGHTWDTRPTVRDTFVAWPNEGYVPYQLVCPRWSFSYPGANFANTTVTMSRDGTPIATAQSPIHNGYGENTLVWGYDNNDMAANTHHPRPLADTTYDVTLANVVIGGQSRTFNYQVIVFDPDVESADAVPVTVSGSATPTLNTPNVYTVARPGFTSHFQWRVLSTSSYSSIEGAENGTSTVTTSTTSGYDVVTTAVKASGAAAFHLAHPVPETQYVRLDRVFLGGTGARLSFQSRLRYATASQVARVQVSRDGGSSWSDVYTQAGSDGPGEGSFALRTVALPDLSGHTFHLRFAYTHGGGSYYPMTGSTAGWFFDDIALTGVSAATETAASANQAGTTFDYTPTATGTYGLQARGVLFNTFPLDWGPVVTVTAAAAQLQAPAIAAHPVGQSVAVNSDVTFSVVATGLPAPTFQWLKDGVPLAGETAATLTLARVQAADAGDYRVRLTNAVGTVTSDVATLSVVDAPRIFFGDFGSASEGAFALLVRADDSGVFLGNLPAGAGWIRYRELSVSTAGAFSFDAGGSVGTVAGQISGNAVAGTVSGAGLSFAGTVEPVAGATAALAGLYEAVMLDSADGVLCVLVGADGVACVFAGSGGELSGTTATISPGGVLNAVLPDGRAVNVTVSPTGAVTGTATIGGQLHEVSGLRDDVSAVRRLVNISVRAQARSGDGIMIAGFVIQGSGSKALLIRGVGPRLADFGVTGVLADPQVRVYRQADPAGSPPLTANDDWSLAPNAGAITAAAEELGAFSLPEGGKDAAVLLSLPAGAYAAHVSGVDGLTGDCMVEVYDADAAVGRESTANLVNISMRGVAGNGADTVTSGFVIAGTAPKRVLIRAVGPELGRYSVTGVLADPQLRLFQKIAGGSDEFVTSNDDWSADGQEDLVMSTSAQVGAFPLDSDSRSAALVIWLAPGVYTAQATSGDASTGVALVETYEVP